MDELKRSTEDLEKEILDVLEGTDRPICAAEIELSCFGTSREVFVALETMFWEGKLGRFQRVIPTTTGVRLDDLWTTKERAEEILKGRGNNQ